MHLPGRRCSRARGHSRARPGAGPRAASYPERKPRLREGKARHYGTFTVSSDDDAQAVGVFLCRETPARLAVALGLFGGLMPWPPGIVILAISLAGLLPRRREPGATEFEVEFHRRMGSASRRSALIVLITLFFTVGALVTLLSRFA